MGTASSYPGDGGDAFPTSGAGSSSTYPASKGASTFTALTDTPDSYTGQGNNIVSVKADASGLEFIPAPSGSFAIPVTIGTENALGSATTTVKSDHVHAHGDQTVGSLHAIASTATNGFMSASDKSKLDALQDYYLALRSEIGSVDPERYEPIEELMIRCKKERYYKFVYFLRVFTEDGTIAGCGFKFMRESEGELTCMVSHHRTSTQTTWLPLEAIDTEVIFPQSGFNNTPFLMRVEGTFFCTNDGTLLPAIRTYNGHVEFKVLPGSIVEWRDYIV
jgi:hypothetical protein